MRHLRYFVAVAEALHFGRAAERLMIAQPALSQQIKQLEAEVAVRLLERTRRRVELTDAGRVFFKQAKELLARAESAVRAAQRVGRGQAGQLVVGFNSGALADLLPRTLRAFRRDFAEVEVVPREMTTLEQVAALRERRIDLGLLCPPIPAADETLLQLEVVMRAAVVATLPRGHALGRRRRVRLRDLSGEGFVICRDDVGYCAQVRAICRAAAGFEPRVVQEAEEGETAMALVEAGLGITLMPAWWRRKLRRPGVVVRDVDDASSPMVEMAVAWRKDQHPPAALCHFLDEVRRARDELALSV